MNDDQIIEKLINGYSLYTYMIPDDTIPTNRPLHAEGFYLPHGLLIGNMFWGMSRSVHVADTVSQGTPSLMWNFCYTNGFGGIFCSYSLRSKSVTFMQLSRYKSHEFIIKNNWELIWDSKFKETYPCSRLHDVIRSGVQLKVAMCDAEGIWNLHPVDLPLYSIDKERFRLKTEYFEYPTLFRTPQAVEYLIQRYNGYFNRKTKSNAEGGGQLAMDCNSNYFACFYNLCSSGSYYNLYDIPRGTTQKYQRLKVFCEKEVDKIKMC